MKQKLSKTLLISFIIGVLYLIYSAVYWSGATANTADTAEQIGAGIATVVVMPHLICTALYTVALVLFPVYFMFVIVEMILSYIGFAKMKKAE